MQNEENVVVQGLTLRWINVLVFITTRVRIKIIFFYTVFSQFSQTQ